MTEDDADEICLAARLDVDEPIDERVRPEMNMLFAMLYRAMLDAVGTTSEPLKKWSDIRGAARLRDNARGWIMSNSDVYAFSFVNVCGFLGLCPEKIRAGLKNHWNAWLHKPVAQSKLPYSGILERIRG